MHTGDITQKGYDKKRSRLLAPFLPPLLPLPPPPTSQPPTPSSSKASQAFPLSSSSAGGAGGGSAASVHQDKHLQQQQQQLQQQHRILRCRVDAEPASPSVQAKRRHHRRVTRHESRYHSGESPLLTMISGSGVKRTASGGRERVGAGPRSQA